MSERADRKPEYLRWLLELFLSIYFAVLAVTLHEGTGFRWSAKLHIYYASHYRPDLRILTDDGYRLYVVAFLLVWALAAAIFLCLRISARFSFTRVALRTLAGLIAIAGYPVASLYYGTGRMLFLDVELILAGSLIVLWAYRKWLVSKPLSVFLLVLHFALWALFGKFPGVLCCLMLWPGWIWNWSANSGDKVRLIYPLLGFCTTLLWAAYFRQSEATERTPALGV